MIRYVRTDSNNPDFKILAFCLEEELKILDGSEHVFYAQLNAIDYLKQVIVAYEIDEPVACGAFQEYHSGTVELKRLYVTPNKRRKGIANQILKLLEAWAQSSGFSNCLLETGKNQPDAIAFYTTHDYSLTPNFGRYLNSPNSICFQKMLNR